MLTNSVCEKRGLITLLRAQNNKECIKKETHVQLYVHRILNGQAADMESHTKCNLKYGQRHSQNYNNVHQTRKSGKKKREVHSTNEYIFSLGLFTKIYIIIYHDKKHNK